MPLYTLQDLLVEQLKDIYSAETQITKALPKLVKHSSNDARQLGQEETVTLIEQNEQEEVAIDRKLTDIAEREVNPQAATAGAGADAGE
jgi:ferritin-like metal-binding protein YciE